MAELEKKQIGRPSTYASILNTILHRDYVKPGDAPGRTVKSVVLTLEHKVITRTETQEVLGRDKNKLIPTPRGIKVTEFLEKNFSTIVDYKFTAKCETLFDDIAEGKRSFASIVPAFDKRLLSWVATVEQQYQDVIAPSDIVVGVFEDHPIIAGKGKYGTFVKHKDSYYSVDENDPEKVALPQAIAAITAKRAGAPKAIGTFEDKEILVGKGRYGTYVKHHDQYYTIAGKEPDAVTVQDAEQAIVLKRQQMADIEKSIVATVGKNYQIRNGQYGLYVTDGKTSASLPKEVSIEEARQWTARQCRERISSYKQWKKQQAKEKKGNNPSTRHK